MSIVDVACKICAEGAETVRDVELNRMKMIYGLLWHDRNISGTSKAAWDCMKAFMSHEEKGQGITMARELIRRVAHD